MCYNGMMIMTKCSHSSHLEIVGDYVDYMRAILIEGECMENILPNGCCFADVTTKSILNDSPGSLCSPFSISLQ